VHVKRPELVVAGAVLLCLPMVPGVLSGGIGAMTALTRFLIALLLCWIGGAVLTAVLSRYSEESRRAEIAKAIDAAQRATAERAAEADAAYRARHPDPFAGPSV